MWVGHRPLQSRRKQRIQSSLEMLSDAPPTTPHDSGSTAPTTADKNWRRANFSIRSRFSGEWASLDPSF